MNPDRLRKVAPWTLALIIAIAAPTGFAQQSNQAKPHNRSVAIGGTTLQLGANQTRVLGEARARFNVSAADDHGQYFLYPKAVPLGEGGQSQRPKAVGSITFSQGHLARVTRNLGSFRSQDGQAAIEHMIQAFADASNTGHQPAVHTDTSMSGNASTTRVYFSYPNRVIQVLVFQPADTSVRATVDITEQYALSNSGRPNATVPGQQ